MVQQEELNTIKPQTSEQKPYFLCKLVNGLVMVRTANIQKQNNRDQLGYHAKMAVPMPERALLICLYRKVYFQ